MKSILKYTREKTKEKRNKMKKIPKFLYHGTAQFNYEILKHCNYNLSEKSEFMCYDDLVGGFTFALKRDGN